MPNARSANLTARKIGLILVLVPLFFQLLSIFLFAQVLNYSHRDLLRLEDEQTRLMRMHELGQLAGKAVVPILNLNREAKDSSLQALDTLKAQLTANLELEPNDSSVHAELKQVLENSRSLTKQIDLLTSKYRKFLSDSTITPNDFRSATRRLFFSIILAFDESSTAIMAAQHRVELKTPHELKHIRFRFALALIAVGLISVMVALFALYVYSKTLIDSLSSLQANVSRMAAGLPPNQIKTNLEEVERIDRGLVAAFISLHEHRLKELAIVNSSPDVACSLDRSLKFSTIAESCTNSWHFMPVDLLRTSLLALIPASHKREIAARFAEIAQNNDGGGRLKTDLYCGDGLTRTFEFAVSWSKTDRCFFAIARDITDATTLERLKARFVSVVSHDVRAPLTVIKGSLTLLLESKRGALNDRIKAELLRLDSEIMRLNHLASDVLQLQKLEHSTLSLDLQAVRLYNICAQAVEFQEQHQSNPAIVKVQLPESDALVLCDEQRLLQAVISILKYVSADAVPGAVVKLAIENAFDQTELCITAVLNRYTMPEAIVIPANGSQVNLNIAQIIAKAHSTSLTLKCKQTAGTTASPAFEHRFSIKLKQLIEDEFDSDKTEIDQR